MGLVQEPIKRLAAPAEADVEVGAQCPCNTKQRADRHAIDEPALDLGHLGPGNTRACRDVHLAPTEPDPERTKSPTETARIHRSIVATSAYLAIGDGLGRDGASA